MEQKYMNHKDLGLQETKRAATLPRIETRLTPEQIKHWRDVLCVTIGPYALIMPDSEVQRIRDAMQDKFGDKTTPQT
jgi:hypothetical protein